MRVHGCEFLSLLQGVPAKLLTISMETSLSVPQALQRETCHLRRGWGLMRQLRGHSSGQVRVPHPFLGTPNGWWPPGDDRTPRFHPVTWSWRAGLDCQAAFGGLPTPHPASTRGPLWHPAGQSGSNGHFSITTRPPPPPQLPPGLPCAARVFPLVFRPQWYFSIC